MTYKYFSVTLNILYLFVDDKVFESVNGDGFRFDSTQGKLLLFLYNGSDKTNRHSTHNASKIRRKVENGIVSKIGRTVKDLSLLILASAYWLLPIRRSEVKRYSFISVSHFLCINFIVISFQPRR